MKAFIERNGKLTVRKVYIDSHGVKRQIWRKAKDLNRYDVLAKLRLIFQQEL